MVVKIYAAELNRMPVEPLTEGSYNNVRERNHRAGRPLLLYGLKQLLDLSPSTLSFKYNEHGKPFLAEYPEVFFNLSHSGNWITCAISDREVGIDVEQIRELRGIVEISKRMFSVTEQEKLMQLEGAEMVDQFFSFWTLKESYVKYMGRGFSLPFNSFSVIETDFGYEVKGREKNPNCFLQLLGGIQGYKLALCSEEETTQEIVQRLNEEDWLTN